MENLLKELQEEIKKVASEENINTTKLNDLLVVYERLKGYETTTVRQVEGVNEAITVPAQPIGRIRALTALPAAPRMNEINIMYDNIIRLVHGYVKTQADNVRVINIHRFIDWHRFLIQVKKESINLDFNMKCVDIISQLESLILKSIEKELEETKKQTESEHIENKEEIK